MFWDCERKPDNLKRRHDETLEPVSGGLEPRIFIRGDRANYSACRKYSQCFICSTFSHVTALFQNRFKFIFYPRHLRRISLNNKAKKVCLKFLQIYLKNTQTSKRKNMYLSILLVLYYYRVL